MDAKTIKRNCVYYPDLFSQRGAGKYPLVKPLVFEVLGVPRDVAAAHLTMAEPYGHVVLVGERGPKGGWGSPRYVTGAKELPKHARYTFHLAFEETSHGTDP